MFTTLLESGTRVTRQDRWLTTSTGLHMMVLAGAVVLTPQRSLEIDDPARDEGLVWVRTAATPTQTAAASRERQASTRQMPAPGDILKTVVGTGIDVLIPDINAAPSSGEIPSEAFPSDVSGFTISRSTPLGGPLSAGAVDKPALPLPGNALPVYPEALRSAGIEGSALMRFVIDTTGRVEPQSVQTVSADQELFVASVRAVLRQHRFLPAEAAGRKVRMLVEQRFDFALNAR